MNQVVEVFNKELILNLGFEYKQFTLKTKNMTGYMRNYLCDISKQFITQKLSENDKIMEIGCGIGAVAESLINIGYKNITTVDADKRHLDAAKLLLQESLNKTSGCKLEFIRDELPYLRSLNNRCFSSILSAQVMHYLKPKEFEIALRRIYELLKVGGKLFLTVGSPYIQSYYGFAEEYEKKRNKIRYPGFLTNPEKYNPKGIQHHPGYFLFFDPVVLKERVSEFGFKVIESYLFDDNNEKDAQTGLVAIKK